MKGRFACAGILLALASMGVAAQTAYEALQRLEASMRVTGWLDIAPDGRATGYTLDHAGQVPEPVAALIGRASAGWRLEPAALGKQPGPERIRMHLKVLARKVPGTRSQFTLSLASAFFGDAAHAHDVETAGNGMRPPGYPAGPLKAGATGTVYLVLKVGRDGAVQDAVAEQVNLGMLASEKRMTGLRKAFARSALAAARGWRLETPADVEPDARYWTVRVPVDFRIAEDHPPEQRGLPQWEPYIPGPRTPPAWLDPDIAAVEPDTFPSGGAYRATAGRRLLGALDPGI